MSLKSDMEFAFPVALLIIIAFFVVLLLSNLTRFVPSQKYVNGLVRSADEGIENLQRLHYPLFVGSLARDKREIQVVYSNLVELSKEIDAFRKKTHKSILIALLSSKYPSFKKKLKSFFATYWDFLKLRMGIIFCYLMSQVIDKEFEVIGGILLIFVLIALRVALPHVWVKIDRERKMKEFLKLLFLAPDDQLEVIEEHPVSGRHTPNVDRFRKLFDHVMSGGKIKHGDAFEFFSEDPSALRILRCMGTVFTYMSMAPYEKGGKVTLLRNEGYPASVTGNHNPHPRFGLLMHSLMVAYTSVRIAYLNGVKDTRELLDVFFAGAVHDAGKIRLYKKVLSKPAVVMSPDAIEGDKHIRQALKTKPVPKWKSLVSSESSMESEEISQMKILISKTKYKTFPDENLIKEYVKPADHICVDAELRYGAEGVKGRREFFRKYLRAFFGQNRSFNSFDREMVGIVFENDGRKSAVIFATLSTRFVDMLSRMKGINMDRLRQLYPLRKISLIHPTNKLRPLSYTLSQYLYENGYLFLSDELKADSVGLYDVLVETALSGRIPYNACWFIEDFERFCEDHGIEPEVHREAKLIEVYERQGRLSDPLRPHDEKATEEEEGDLSIFEGSGADADRGFGGEEEKEDFLPVSEIDTVEIDGETVEREESREKGRAEKKTHGEKFSEIENSIEKKEIESLTHGEKEEPAEEKTEEQKPHQKKQTEKTGKSKKRLDWRMVERVMSTSDLPPEISKRRESGADADRGFGGEEEKNIPKSGSDVSTGKNRETEEESVEGIIESMIREHGEG